MSLTGLDLAGGRMFLARHCGMAGPPIVGSLAGEGGAILVAPRGELDLKTQFSVRGSLVSNRLDIAALAAAKAIKAAYVQGAAKLLILVATCIYRKLADQPIVQGALLAVHLEDATC